jgi:membrane-bound serine protease (ClpP class)
MCGFRFLFLLLLIVNQSPLIAATNLEKEAPVYVIPIRDEIEETIVYVVRRGVNEAVDHKAKAIILDMSTNGGRGDAMEEIMQIIDSFKGETITYVNKKAYSAGAFIAVSTQHIYMAPSSVIGAAAPVMMGPSGGVEDLPSTYQKKIASAFSARIRAAAQRHGHNPELVDAMVKETEGLTIDGKEIVKKGEILTLTDSEATMLVGKPSKPLLAEGTANNLNEIYKKFGYDESQVVTIKPTGMERLARLITLMSPLLLLIGIGGIYLEVKTPGVSLPGIIGVTALVIFFCGHYVAGLSGSEEILLFALGLVLIGVELFLFPGHIIPGLVGVVAVLTALLWAMVDKLPGSPVIPTIPQIQLPLIKLTLSLVGAMLLITLLARFLPKSKGPLGGLVLNTQMSSRQGFSTADQHQELIGEKGITLSILRPSGSARVGNKILDVMTEGEFVSANQEVIIREVRGAQIIVSKV